MDIKNKLKGIEEYFEINLEEAQFYDDNRWAQSYTYLESKNNVYGVNENNEIVYLCIRRAKKKILPKILYPIKENLKFLVLSENEFEAVSGLKEFKEIFLLDLTSCKLTNVDFIKDFKKLDHLFLSNNKIEKLPNIELSLRVVYLDYNKIKDIKSIGKFKNLFSLSLSNNEISDISIFSNISQKFENINLDDNQILDISPLAFLEIEKLSIRNNKIFDLSPIYKSLKSEKIKILNFNDLNNLFYPRYENDSDGVRYIIKWFDTIIDFCNIKIKKNKEEKKTILDLGMMGLTDLSLIPELFELEHLEELILSNEWAEYDDKEKIWKKTKSKNNVYPNNIFNVPNEFEKLKNLKKLIIGGDWKDGGNWNRWRINKHISLGALHKLEYLNLSNNEITGKYFFSPFLPNLKVLFLNNNKISSFVIINKNEINLEELYLSNNEITKLHSLAILTSFTTIDLHENKIETLEPILNLLKNSSIDITDTKWEKNTINIKNNPIKQPNFETILNGKNAVIRYFQSEWKKVVNKEVKLILVGNSEVGKTTLVKYLDQEKKLESPHDATHWMIEKDITSKLNVTKLNEKCNLRVFDFGGQDYYHDTHQIFFSGKTVYLLLWEKETNNNNKRKLDQVINGNKRTIITQDYPVEYWLESIKHFTKVKSNILSEKNKIAFEFDSKLLMIQNKVHKASEIVHLNNFRLIQGEKYPFIYDFININIKPERRNLKYFDSLLTEIINEMENVGEEVLEYQDNIRNHLKKYDGKPILSFNEFCEYCNKQLYKEISEEELKDLCGYLKQLGLILCLPDFSKIYIDKNWIFECIYNTLDGLLEKEGEFDEDYLKVVINRIGGFIDDSIEDGVIQLMLEHKIIFKNLKTNKYIAPLYLPNEPAEGVSLFLLENRIPFRRFEYNGFIHKTFILDFYSKYGEKTISDGTRFYYWKDGLIIKDENSGQILHIKFNNSNENSKASIDVYKLNDIDKQNTFVLEIIKSIKEINNKFFKIEEEDLDKKRVDIEDYYEELVTVNNIDFISYDLIQKNNLEKKFVFNERKLIDLKENKLDANKNINLMDYKQFIEKQDMLNKIFISYSKKDLGMVNVFKDHLSALVKDKLLNTWYCTELEPGEEWNPSIQKHFDDSNIICFMISPYFMKTDYIFEYEVKKAFERKAKDDKLIIIPIIMDFCIWTSDNPEYNLGKFTALPYTAKPVTDFGNQNAAWLIIAECIKTVIKIKEQPENEDFFSRNNYYNNTQLRDLFERLVKGELNKKN